MSRPSVGGQVKQRKYVHGGRRRSKPTSKPTSKQTREQTNQASFGGKTHDKVVLGVIGLAPGGHDVWVVGGNHNHLVDALGLEGVNVLDEAGQVAGLACGREGAGDSHDDDLFVLELCCLR